MMARGGLAISALVALAGCDDQAGAGPVFAPEYRGIETRLLEGDLVQFKVSMTGARTPLDVESYAECAAAQYALIRGFGFARHLRTNVYETGGVWTADAVYTVSPSLPRGVRQIDAEVLAADCAENGIPMV